MSQHHTAEAFDARMKLRMTVPTPITEFRAYYHMALMPGWEPIVAEQLAVFAHVGIKAVYGAVLTPSADALNTLKRIAAHYGVSLAGTEPVMNPGFDRVEGPTLKMLRAWCVENPDPDKAVLYVHTKGVSVPHDRHKKQWRRVMTARMVGDTAYNLKRVEIADIVGCAWQSDANFPHFCGNFWWARNDWVCHLQDLDEYRHGRPDFLWAGVHSWRGRMFAETWVGSMPWHHIESLIPTGYRMWDNDVYVLDATVKGFDYDAPLYLGE